MKKSYVTFPFNTVALIYIIFNTLIVPLFGNSQLSVLFLIVSTCTIIIIMIVGEIMIRHQADLPTEIFFAILVVLPIVSSWIIILTRGEKKQVVSAELSEPIIIALVSSGGTVLAGIIVGGAALYKVWKDSKTISDIKESVGDVKAEVKSAKGSELKNIESHTSDIHKNMLSKVLPGMEKLDSINRFVTKIDINTQNSGGDIKLIFAEVNKMVEKLESLQKELDSVKKESQKKEEEYHKRDKEYLGQIAVLRAENSQLKDRNEKLELTFGRRDRDQYIEM